MAEPTALDAVAPPVPVGDDSADLLVLGAGTAGLAAAARAAERGYRVLVVDHAEHVGGLAASVEVAGMAVDYGSHRLPARLASEVQADLTRLLGTDLQLRRRTARVRVEGQWVEPDSAAGDLRRRLPRSISAGMGRRVRPFRRDRPTREPGSFAAVMRERVGDTVYDALYEPYAQKMFGLPGDRLAGDPAARLVLADPHWRASVRGPADGATYHYPRRGFGQIASALAEHAVAAGATLRLGTEIDAVEPAFGSVVIRTIDGSTLTARHAFSTLPLPRLARSTRPGPPLNAIETATRLRFRAMVLVFLVHRGGRWTAHDCHHFPGADTPVLRIGEPANYRDSADDPAGHSVICAELPATVGDEIWRADEATLAGLVADTAARHDLPPIAVDEVVVHRSPTYYPTYTLGFDRDLSGLVTWLRGIPSVTSFGRFGLFFHDNTHHALLLAREAVDALGPDAAFDHQRWDRGRARIDALHD